jgi:hypothetical protein
MLPQTRLSNATRYASKLVIAIPVAQLIDADQRSPPEATPSFDNPLFRNHRRLVTSANSEMIRTKPKGECHFLLAVAGRAASGCSFRVEAEPPVRMLSRRRSECNAGVVRLRIDRIPSQIHVRDQGQRPDVSNS